MTSSPTPGEMAREMAIVEEHIHHAGRPVTIVWAILMAATVVSWHLGDAHLATRLVAVLVVVTGFVKVALIGEHFMELRTAPPRMRWVFLGWCVLVPTVLCGIYLTRS